MTKIDIKKTLFKPLKEDYNNPDNQLVVTFSNGLDYLEAMVKFLGILNISVVKEIDKEVYEKIFFTNFKISPSLGDFKSLATQPFTKANKNILKTKENELYKVLDELFTKEKVELELTMAEDIILDATDTKKKKINHLWNLFEEYVVNFRNKLKGHGASFNAEDTEQAKLILDNLDKVIITVEFKLDTLLENEELAFYVVEEDEKEEHASLEVIAIYKEKSYQLSPLMIYLKCNKFSCKKNHHVKLFFYNDGKASKSYYIDYSHNHYYYFSSNNEIDSSLKQMLKIQQEINSHDTSDDKRQSDLLSVFVGREEELRASKKHITQSIKDNVSSAITVKGKPGTGKSAFISKLQSELEEELKLQKVSLKSYVFYVRKGEMDSDENKYFYNKLAGYLSTHDIEIKKLENAEEATQAEKMENLFSSLESQFKEPLLLVIDGLDEFKQPSNFLSGFPLTNIPTNVQLVFSTRGYKDILNPLQQKLFDSGLKVLNKGEYIKNSSSITLGGLSEFEVQSLINEVLTKDIDRNSNIYIEIKNEIFDKSEGLPLYIRYITDKLITFDINSGDITTEILAYTKELPTGLDSFYYRAFEELDSISTKILYILFFSRKAVSFNSFYALVKNLGSDIDHKEFQAKNFSKVEIFLNQNNYDDYGFYHLSVKEAIKSYFTDQNENLQDIVSIDYEAFSKTMPIAPYQVEQYKSLFQEFYYLKEDSTLFELLNSLQELLQDKKDDKKLSQYFKDNYQTLVYKQIFFQIFQESILYKDIQNRDYSSFEEFQVSKTLYERIKHLFKVYEDSEKIDIEEIKQSHELALLTQNYDRVLKYADDFKNAFFNIFIDIVWNLYKSENQKLFKEYKYIWEDIYSDDFKLLLLKHKKIVTFTDLALEIAKSCSKTKKSIVASSGEHEALSLIAQKTKNIEQAMKIANSIKDIPRKYEALSWVSVKANDIEYLNSILKEAITKSTESNAGAKADDEISGIFSVMYETSNMNNYNKIIKVLHGFSSGLRAAFVIKKFRKRSDRTQNKLFYQYIEMIEGITLLTAEYIYNGGNPREVKELLNSAIEITKIIDDHSKSTAISIITTRTDDIMIFTQILELISLMENNIYKAESLLCIVKKTTDEKTLINSLKIASTIIYDKNTAEIFLILSEKMDNKELFGKALQILISVESEKLESKILSKIALESDSLDITLDIVNSIKDEKEKIPTISKVALKIENIDRALEVASIISDEKERLSTISKIALKIENIDRALEVASTISDEKERLSTISKIAQNTDCVDRALEIANSFEEDKTKLEILESIKVNITAIENALQIANSITDDWDRSRALSSIAKNIDDTTKALEISESLHYYKHQAEIIGSIAKKTGDTELFQKALDIASLVESKDQRAWILSNIALSVGDIDKAIEIACSIDDDSEVFDDLGASGSKADTLSEIALKIKDIYKALEVAKLIRNDSGMLEYTLSEIAQNTNNIDKALEISSIEFNNEGLDILKSIISKVTSVDKSLKIINLITNDEEKSKVLASVALDIDDIEKALEVANLINNDILKSEIFSNIFNKTTLVKYFPNNLIYKINQNLCLHPQSSISLISAYDKESVLKHLKVNIESDILDTFVFRLEKLRVDREQAEVDENEELCDLLTAEAQKIKDNIEKNEIILKFFLLKYTINKMKFNRMDLLDII